MSADSGRSRNQLDHSNARIRVAFDSSIDRAPRLPPPFNSQLWSLDSNCCASNKSSRWQRPYPYTLPRGFGFEPTIVSPAGSLRISILQHRRRVGGVGPICIGQKAMLLSACVDSTYTPLCTRTRNSSTIATGSATDD